MSKWRRALPDAILINQKMKIQQFTVIVAECPRVHLTGAVYLLDILFRYLTKYLNKFCRNAPSISSPWGWMQHWKMSRRWATPIQQRTPGSSQRDVGECPVPLGRGLFTCAPRSWFNLILQRNYNLPHPHKKYFNKNLSVERFLVVSCMYFCQGELKKTASSLKNFVC